MKRARGWSLREASARTLASSAILPDDLQLHLRGRRGVLQPSEACRALRKRFVRLEL